MLRLIAKIRLLSRKINQDDIMPWSSMLTIYLLLSIFPLVIVLTEVLSRTTLNNPELFAYWINLLPKSVFSTIESIAIELVGNQDSTIIPTALIITLWSSSRGILAIIKALNKAYNIKETRGYIRLRLLALSYTLGLVVLIVLVLFLVVFGNTLLSLVPASIQMPDSFSILIDALRYLLSVLFSFMFFVSLYNLCPSEKVGFVKVMPGALVASLGLIGVSMAFSFYINRISNLSYLYGSLTSVVILILWLFLVSVVIMVGGEVNAVFSSQIGKENE